MECPRTAAKILDAEKQWVADLCAYEVSCVWSTEVLRAAAGAAKEPSDPEPSASFRSSLTEV